MGSAKFLGSDLHSDQSGQVFVEIDHRFIALFRVKSKFRKGWEDLLGKLSKNFKLALLSGDNERDKTLILPYFESQNIHFNLKPQDKLNFISQMQDEGEKVLMIGDGLNDAGALSRAHVGVALSEDVNAFSPSCDVIMDAGDFNRLGNFINYSKTAMNVVRAGFVLSMVYNVIGIGLAVSGILSPLYAAIFMPFSNITVVLFSVGMTYLYGKFKSLN